jgi:hypothetical protein
MQSFQSEALVRESIAHHCTIDSSQLFRVSGTKKVKAVRPAMHGFQLILMMTINRLPYDIDNR